MPLKKLPTKQETKAATELQAPFNTDNRPIKQKAIAQKHAAQKTIEAPARRSLSDAGLDSTPRTWFDKEELFNTEDPLISIPFMVAGAHLAPNKFSKTGQQNLVLAIRIDDAERPEGMISLPYSETDYTRSFVLGYFQTNTVPLGPLELHKIQLSDDPNMKPYLALNDAPDDVIPF